MRNWHVLAETLADLIIKETQSALADALASIEAILLEQNNMGGPGASERMDSMLSLRMEKNKLLASWPEQVRKYSVNFGNAPVTLGELTLVTDAEMEASLAAGAMGENFHRNQKALFKALEEQFEKLLDLADRGEVQGIRHSATAAEAPIHPFGLAQLACTWLLQWNSPDQDRLLAINQVEKKLIEALPRLLPAGLAAIENFINGQDKIDIPETLDISDAAPVNSMESSNAPPPDDVLPLMGALTDNKWMDALAEAQEGLYESSVELSPVSDIPSIPDIPQAQEPTRQDMSYHGMPDSAQIPTPPPSTAPGTKFTPEFSSLLDDGSHDLMGGIVNTPLYLDDLIRSRQQRVNMIPERGYVEIDSSTVNMPINDMGLDTGMGGAVNIPPMGPSPAQPQADTRTLAQALMSMMNRLGSWAGIGSAEEEMPRGRGMPQTGSEILEHARRENYLAQQNRLLEEQRSQQLKYTGKRGYDPTLDLAQIDESDFDPAMSELIALLKEKRAMSKNSRDYDQVRRPRISPASLGQALRSLQQNPDEAIIEAARNAGRREDISLAQVLKDAITQHSRQAGAPEDGELDDADSDAADIVGMLFEIFLTERQIEDQMRGHIAKLVAPYVRVAVNDRKLFMQKTHPARRYLDTLAAAVDGNQGANFQEKQMLDKAGSSIDHLLESFNEDLAIFELAEEEMRQYIEQRKAAMAASEKRAADAQRGKERLEQAKLLADMAFEKAIEECNWPVKTLEMLRGWWCQHHRMALLQDNPQAAVAESERLLELLVKVGNAGVVSIGTDAVRVHNDIINMLASSGLTGQNAQNATSELWAALEQASIWTRLAAQGQLSSDDLAKTSTKASRQAGKAAQAAQVAPGFQDLSPEVADETIDLPGQGRTEQEAETHEDLPVPDYFSSNQELVDYFKNMSLGTWVDFVTPDRKLVAAKLSWISPISNRLLFVTARGTKHSVESAENLAMMVKLDRVRLRRAGLGESGFDSSYRRALDVLAERIKSDDRAS